MNTFGRFFRLTTWGESHGPAIGMVVDGCPAGLELGAADIQAELDLRRPGQSDLTTPRAERDEVEILSGLFEGRTTGAPIGMLIRNRDARPRDYEPLAEVFRPGQADYTYQAKYGIRDHRGSGRASGRETAARVAGGAVAMKLLARRGIGVIAFARRIGGVELASADPFAAGFDGPDHLQRERRRIYAAPARCPEEPVGRRMEEEIRAASGQGDSVGGIVEVQAHGLPAGLGEPVFGKLDALAAQAVLSVGAVKGVEFGAGFGLAGMRGSEANDAYTTRRGEVVPATNRAGGVLGGISTGLPLVARAVVKPTSSIGAAQKSVDRQGRPIDLSIGGRHDPCIVIRVIPVLEHMLNLVLIDLLFAQNAMQGV